jgi:O-methyltransferase involved in polyketide biosynthesis
MKRIKTLKRGLKFFELDQPATQKLKVECLKKAGIDVSHVTFIQVDFMHFINL